MSAICGVVGVDGRPWTAADLDGMMRAQARLGPDGAGSWDGTVGRCGVAVAVALRHATPEDKAEQLPARARDDSLVLVGDLRVDNRGELAGQLRLVDEPSTPDGAFVLAAYERWGEAMLDRIVGDFAVAIVDRARGGVLLARDHMGARPLAVHRRRGVVAFASMPLALTGFEDVGHDLDVHHAVEILAVAYTSERTFVDGVHWVPAGGALWIDDGGIRQWKWWNPDPHEIFDLGARSAYENELRDAFDRAVESRLRSAGRVGAMTSGGLDSTSAAATGALLVAPERFPTFTAVPPPDWTGTPMPGWDADEASLVRDLARAHRNLAPTFVHVPSASSLFDLHEPLWNLGAGPAANPANMLWLHAIRTQAGSAGVTSLITGDFGNLFFSADGPEWLAAHLRAGRVATMLREAAAWRRSTDDGWYTTLRDGGLGHLAPAGLRRLIRTASGPRSALEDWIAASALRPECIDALDLPALLPQVDERRRDRRVVALSMRAHYAGQADVAHALWALTGVESRDPTSDRRVVEVARRQPEWIRRHKGVTRAVARGAMADRLPASIANRTRRGEQLPEWLDLMTSSRAEVAAELGEIEDHSTSRELIDTARLRKLVGNWPEREARTNPSVVRDYRLALFRALTVGRYLRWFESRAVSAG